MRKPREVRRTAILVTVGLAVVVVAAGIIVALLSRSRAGDAALGAASGSTAASLPAPLSPDALSRAADLVGFHSTMGPDVGIVETLPADTAMLPGSASLLAVGKQAPDFTLQTPTGDRKKLSDYRGRTLLLEFFATWCPHCQAEAAHLIQLSSALPKEKYAFLSVNADSEDAASIHAYERWFKIPWPSLLDPGSPAGSFTASGGYGPVTSRYGVQLYPTFYIVDPKGLIAWRSDREQPDALLLQKLKDASGS